MPRRWPRPTRTCSPTWKRRILRHSLPWQAPATRRANPGERCSSRDPALAKESLPWQRPERPRNPRSKRPQTAEACRASGSRCRSRHRCAGCRMPYPTPFRRVSRSARQRWTIAVLRYLARGPNRHRSFDRPPPTSGNAINIRREEVCASAEIEIQSGGIGASYSVLVAGGDPRVVGRAPPSPLHVSRGEIQSDNRIFIIIRRLATQNRLLVSVSGLLTRLNGRRNQIVVARRHVNLAPRDIDHGCAGPHWSARVPIRHEVRLPEDLPVRQRNRNEASAERRVVQPFFAGGY